MTKLAWSLRRLYCPVSKTALVLEVGSGGSPYFRANVLIDAHVNTRERHWAPFVVDRPSVLGFGENLPFADKTFDFVIASHVLEHSDNPQKFLEELQRVGKAGYIETPDAFMERINPYWDHRSEVTVRDGKIYVRKKSSWNIDPELVDLYEERAKKIIAGRVIPENPFDFHVRFYWKESIPFVIINPEINSAWTPPSFEVTTAVSQSLKARLARVTLKFIRAIFSQNARNNKLDVSELLRCPKCGSTDMAYGVNQISCRACETVFSVVDSVPHLYP
jgi:SAM-dependent methyltransferase/uncharacterized protein YbaR (Trm112 family)